MKIRYIYKKKKKKNEEDWKMGGSEITKIELMYVGKHWQTRKYLPIREDGVISTLICRSKNNKNWYNIVYQFLLFLQIV